MQTNRSCYFIFLLFISGIAQAQRQPFISADHVRPLQVVTVAGLKGSFLRVLDGDGQIYLRMPVKAVNSFMAGGAPGRQTIVLYDAKQK